MRCEYHRAILFALVELGENNELVASNYAKLAKDAADLEIIAWTLERLAH